MSYSRSNLRAFDNSIIEMRERVERRHAGKQSDSAKVKILKDSGAS